MKPQQAKWTQALKTMPQQEHKHLGSPQLDSEDTAQQPGGTVHAVPPSDRTTTNSDGQLPSVSSGPKPGALHLPLSQVTAALSKQALLSLWGASFIAFHLCKLS